MCPLILYGDFSKLTLLHRGTHVALADLQQRLQSNTWHTPIFPIVIPCQQRVSCQWREGFPSDLLMTCLRKILDDEKKILPTSTSKPHRCAHFFRSISSLSNIHGPTYRTPSTSLPNLKRNNFFRKDPYKWWLSDIWTVH